MRVLVCGGRDYTDEQFVFRTLDRVHAKHTINLIIEGGARGADRYARAWAIAHDVACDTEEANWNEYGRAAGFIRNTAMLKSNPDVVIAFPGGPGTANMMKQAKLAGVLVWQPRKIDDQMG